MNWVCEQNEIRLDKKSEDCLCELLARSGERGGFPPSGRSFGNSRALWVAQAAFTGLSGEHVQL